VRRNDARVDRRSPGAAHPTLPHEPDQEQHEQRQQHGTGRRLSAAASSRFRCSGTATAGNDVSRHPVTIHRRSYESLVFSDQFETKCSANTLSKSTFVEKFSPIYNYIVYVKSIIIKIKRQHISVYCSIHISLKKKNADNTS